MNEKWHDEIQIEPIIWFGLFVIMLTIALFVNDISEIGQNLLSMGAVLCATRVRSPIKK